MGMFLARLHFPMSFKGILTPSVVYAKINLFFFSSTISLTHPQPLPTRYSSPLHYRRRHCQNQFFSTYIIWTFLERLHLTPSSFKPIYTDSVQWTLVDFAVATQIAIVKVAKVFHNLTIHNFSQLNIYLGIFRGFRQLFRSAQWRQTQSRMSLLQR